MATGVCPWCGKKVDKFIVFRGDVVGCKYCGIHTKETNADHIRSMTDEELADALFYGQFTTKQDTLDWLKQEVDKQ